MINKFYLTTRLKLSISLIIATLWFGFSYYLAIPWVLDLSNILNLTIAYILIFGIALLPGFFNAYLLISLLLDKRPKNTIEYSVMPAITVLVAAYNEEDTIIDTLDSIFKQKYNGDVEVIVCDDGSIDKTADLVKKYSNTISDNFSLKLLTGEPNKGKSEALNRGLKESNHDLIITIDADSYLFKDSLINLVGNYLTGPENTAAVAGTVLVRNSRENWLTKTQEWEYFIALSLVKRSQSLYQGTLVAQGAFSLYKKSILQELNGWPKVVGEDIVLTWGIQNLGYRVGHAENAIIFTNVPETYNVFFKQRERWSRGLIEAFKKYPQTIWKLKQNTPFIWFNLLFPFLDFVFLFGFVPGLIAALLFQWYHIVSLLTVLLLPMAITLNYLVYRKHVKTFDELGIKVRKNYIGYFLFMLGNQLLLTPACLKGYFAEFLNLKKSWGTKFYKKRKKISFMSKLVYSFICGLLLSSLILWPLFAFGSDNIDVKYEYQLDNDYYESHQELIKFKKDSWIVNQNYFVAYDHDISYNYNLGLILKEFSGDIFNNQYKITAGPGILDTSVGNLNAIYKFTGNFQFSNESNVEFNAERIPQMNANGQGDVSLITNNLIDSYMLSHDYQINNISLTAGIFTNQISDGNSKNGFILKENYIIDDNFLIEGRHRFYWHSDKKLSYFNPEEYQQHWLLLNYSTPLFDDNALLKLSAGPGLTKINDDLEITRIYEVQLKTNIKGMKSEFHYNCFTGMSEYENCTIGTTINIPF